MPAAQKTFLFPCPERDLGAFRAFVRQAVRMKPYGRVVVDVSPVASRALHELPPGGSAWHEYAYYHASLCKFFPHPKIAGHLPPEWVASNRKLLLDKAAVLREQGLEATFMAHEPNFLPESFFQEHPHLRGPRIDHPRRSRREEFALCVDLPEALEMYTWMMAELKRHVPELSVFTFRTNDAGGGFCWAAAQYAGPNGPRHCQARPVAERVRGFVEALHRGAEQGGGPLEVRIGHCNFWRNELDVVTPHLPPRTVIQDRDRAGLWLPTMFARENPVRGLLDPFALCRAMERYAGPEIVRVTMPFGSMYDRVLDRPEVMEKTLDLVEDAIRAPAQGLLPVLQRVRRFAEKWAGAAKADAVLEAFVQIHHALDLRRASAPDFHALYHGVTMRYLTRPLLIQPQALRPEEEAYFLPYIFNPSLDEARMDYADCHGGRTEDVPVSGALKGALASLAAAARTLEGAGGPEGAWLKRVGRGYRIWASIMRSSHNFFFAQQIRDRNRELLAGPPRVPPKVESWDGHPDILPWNELLRDEMDNALELLALLEDGGLELVQREPKPELEDMFGLGPDLAGALKQKVALMRAHWRDAEAYLCMPHK